MWSTIRGVLIAAEQSHGYFDSGYVTLVFMASFLLTVTAAPYFFRSEAVGLTYEPRGAL